MGSADTLAYVAIIRDAGLPSNETRCKICGYASEADSGAYSRTFNLILALILETAVTFARDEDMLFRAKRHASPQCACGGGVTKAIHSHTEMRTKFTNDFLPILESYA